MEISLKCLHMAVHGKREMENERERDSAEKLKNTEEAA